MGWKCIVAVIFATATLASCQIVPPTVDATSPIESDSDVVTPTAEEVVDAIELAPNTLTHNLYIDIGAGGTWHVLQTAIPVAHNVSREYHLTLDIFDSGNQLIQSIPDIQITGVSGDFFVFTDLHFADWTGNGYLDMSVRVDNGGSIGNDPHHFWLWDVVTGQFVFNHELTQLSHMSSVGIATGDFQHDGTIFSQYRESMFWVSNFYRWEDEHLVRVSSQSYRLGRAYFAVLSPPLGQAYLDPDFFLVSERDNVVMSHHVIEGDWAYELVRTDAHTGYLYIGQRMDGVFVYRQHFLLESDWWAVVTHPIMRVDMNFDGVTDILISLGHFGVRGTRLYAAFLRQGDSYVATNFSTILNPQMNTDYQLFESINGNVNFFERVLYGYENGQFVPRYAYHTHSDPDGGPWQVTTTIRSGQAIEEVFATEDYYWLITPDWWPDVPFDRGWWELWPIQPFVAILE